MKIVPMRWADVPEGTLVLCPDGVQREIGPTDVTLGNGAVRRLLGITSSNRTGAHATALHGLSVERRADAATLVVEPDPVDDSTFAAVMIFMRAGFTVEVLPG